MVMSNGSKKKILMVAFITILFVLGGYFIISYYDSKRLLYEPHINPEPLLSVYSSSVIDTVLDFPYQSISVKNGINLNTGKSQDGIKERIFIHLNRTDIYLTLYYKKADALKLYNFYRNTYSSDYIPIYTEKASEGNKFYSTYIEQFKSSETRLPSGQYCCKAGYLTNNLVVSFSSTLRGKNDNSLNEAIKYIGEMLAEKRKQKE